MCEGDFKVHVKSSLSLYPSPPQFSNFKSTSRQHGNLFLWLWTSDPSEDIMDQGELGCSQFWFYKKKITKLNFFFFRKTKTGSNRPVSVRFFREKNRFKPVWLGFFGFGSVWLGFFGLARFWLGLARFFSGFFFGSVRFFRFQA